MNSITGPAWHSVLTGARALVLDFDGTLADTTAVHENALRSALSRHGVSLDSRWYREHVGQSIHDLLRAMPNSRRLPLDQIVQDSRSLLLERLDTIEPIECTTELLQHARSSGLPCAVASGAAGSLVHPTLEALGLCGEFAAVVVREDVARGKPAPDLFLEAARRLGVPAADCLAVDDSPEGITAARTAGMRTLTVADGIIVPT